MPRIFTFILIFGIIGLLGFLAFLLLFGPSEQATPNTSGQQIESTDWQSEGQQQIQELPDRIGTYSGITLSDEPLLNNPDSSLFTDGIYVNTTADDYYRIYYVENQSHITIELYNENLALSRELAEKQLRSIFPNLSEEELCDIQTKVITNDYVLPGYTGKNFGLSFCPFSTAL